MATINDVYNLSTKSDTKGLKDAAKESGVLGKALGAIGKIGKAPFNAIKGAIGGVGKALGAAAKGLALFGLAARGIKTIKRIFGDIFNSIKAASPVMAKAVDDLQAKFKTLLGPILAKAGAALAPVIEKIAKLLDDPRIQKFINMLTGAFLDAIVLVANFITDTLIPAFVDLFGRIGPLADQISGPLSKAWETFKTIATAVWEWVRDHVIAPLVSAWRSLEPEFTKTWQAILDWWNVTAPKIQIVIDQLFGENGTITTAVKTGITVISDVLKVAMAIIRGDWDAAWEGLKTTAADSVPFLQNVTQSIATIIGGILGVDLSDVLNKAARSVVQFGIIVAYGFTDFVNGIIDTINSVLQYLNDVDARFYANQKLMGMNGKAPTSIGLIPRVPYPNIPSFAAGSIVNNPMLAMIGDSPKSKGGEVVAPLTDLLGMIQKAVGGGVNIVINGPFGDGYTPRQAGEQAGNGFIATLRAQGIYT